MINDNIGRVPPEAMPQLEKLARLAGYRFLLREVAHEKTVLRGAALDVTMKWANVGVGKLYRSFDLLLSLRNDAGQTVITTKANTDPREWLPGERNVGAVVQIPAGLERGDYTLAVALIDPASPGRTLSLAIDAPAKDGWYLVSHMRVE